MNKIKKKKRNCLFILSGYIALWILIMLSTAFSTTTRRALNEIYRDWWESIEPQSYYIEFKEFYPFGGFHWKVYVVDGKPQWTNMERTRETEHTKQSSWFSEESVSVDALFDFVGEKCIYQGFLDCGIHYDFWYRYPKEAEAYQWFIFEVVEFISCDKHPDECALVVPQIFGD